MGEQYIVLWLCSSGLEVKEAHILFTAEEATKKFNELVIAQGMMAAFGADPKDLACGKKQIYASGTDHIIHAFRP